MGTSASMRLTISRSGASAVVESPTVCATSTMLVRGCLPEREVDRVLRRLAEVGERRRLDHADDFDPSAAFVVQPEAPAHRVEARPVVAGKRVVDDRDRAARRAYPWCGRHAPPARGISIVSKYDSSMLAAQGRTPVCAAGSTWPSGAIDGNSKLPNSGIALVSAADRTPGSRRASPAARSKNRAACVSL